MLALAMLFTLGGQRSVKPCSSLGGEETLTPICLKHSS